jgi:hypothetical protein
MLAVYREVQNQNAGSRGGESKMSASYIDKLKDNCEHFGMKLDGGHLDQTCWV